MTFYRKAVSVKTAVDNGLGLLKSRIALLAKLSLTV